ncbi:MAG: FHA domain-containing protein [Planctomycetes bacterium]|nr:FHA domain-containing protein [Planctomycetota bacterium]
MATLIVIFGGKEERTYTLDRPRMVVGREPQCEIAIDNLGISRQHCALVSKGDAFVVQDLGSANGTFVNGKKIVEHFLNDGDEIFLGKYVLKFKNETQTQTEAPRDSSVVPDTLNTFVMDGAKIQEQLTKMRAQSGGSAPGQAPAMPAASATAKDYAKAMDVPKAPDNSGTLKTVLIVGGVLVALLLIAVVVLLVVVMKRS